MTTENVATPATGTPEGQTAQKTTEEQFYGKPTPEPTATATANDKVVEASPEVKAEQAAQVEFEIKLPENAVLEPELAKEFTKYAKEKGLSQEVAQEMFERQNALVQSYAQKQQQQIETEIKQWAEQARADKEVGGERLNESVHLAKQVIDRFGTPELKQALDRGMGNHPEAIRIFARIGKELFANDQMVHSKANTKVEKSVEELFYGTNK